MKELLRSVEGSELNFFVYFVFFVVWGDMRGVRQIAEAKMMSIFMF